MQIRTRQRGNCSTLAGKSRGGTPFCRTLKIVFPKSRIFCKAFPLQLFHRNSCKIVAYCFRETRRGGLVRPASKSCRFSHHPLPVPKAWHRDFAACGQRSGLLALNLASIFEKLLDQKTFGCLRLIVCNQSQIQFASQTWATRPHLGSIFKKLLHRKTFQLPAARISAAISKNLTVLVFFHKNFPIT